MRHVDVVGLQLGCSWLWVAAAVVTENGHAVPSWRSPQKQSNQMANLSYIMPVLYVLLLHFAFGGDTLLAIAVMRGV